ncbi:MAG TPA: hypothetical protein PLK90_09030 [Clostridiales bacterium]|nr:hypothetical protein [Clostridiales bacterium]HQP70528.1 hypothetical protein [Clostridiales bacterium]
MKKNWLGLILLSVSLLFSQYSVGETVNLQDDLSWTITGPSGNSEVGNSSTVFSKITEQKAVFLFMGESW